MSDFDDAIHKLVAMAMWSTRNGICEESNVFVTTDVGKRCIEAVRAAKLEAPSSVPPSWQPRAGDSVWFREADGSAFGTCVKSVEHVSYPDRTETQFFLRAVCVPAELSDLLPRAPNDIRRGLVWSDLQGSSNA